MIKAVLLDSGPLGRLAYPNPEPAISAWSRAIIAAGTKMIVPEIADYEVRRELVRAQMRRSLRRLNELKNSFVYLPITTEVMLAAAELWAAMRNRGRPISGKDTLDADAILAAQANTLNSRGVRTIVATENVRHLGQMTHAEYWHDILPDA